MKLLSSNGHIGLPPNRKGIGRFFVCLALFAGFADKGFSQVAPQFCCPGENLVGTNGNFQQGNTGFNSSYQYWAPAGVDATLPGRYNIVNAQQANTICPNWRVQNRFTCNPNPLSNPGRFMVVNGRTGGGGWASIWNRNINLPVTTEPKDCIFCFRVKHLPACCFDVKPTIRVNFTGTPAPTPATSAPFTVTTGSNTCDWQLITVAVTVPGSCTTLNASIALNQGAVQMDGNDLALDDVGFFVIPKVPASAVLFELDTSNLNGTSWNLTATYTGTLPPGCQYRWTVYRVDNTGAPVLGTEVMTPPASWSSTNTSTVFNGYNGVNGTLNGPSPGTFLTMYRYRVRLTVTCGDQVCGDSKSTSRPSDFMEGRMKVENGPLKALDIDEKGTRPNQPMKLNPEDRPLPKGPGTTPAVPPGVDPRETTPEPKIPGNPGRPEVKPMPKETGDPRNDRTPPKETGDPKKDRTPPKETGDPKKEKTPPKREPVDPKKDR